MLEYDKITHQIIGCCFTIHNELGNGFQEVIYQRCLGIELELSGLDYAREFIMPIYYRKHHVGTRRADFQVAGEIMVELKAVKTLDDVHLNQAMNYLEAYRLYTGLLINFGNTRLQYKRIYNNKLKP